VNIHTLIRETERAHPDTDPREVAAKVWAAVPAADVAVLDLLEPLVAHARRNRLRETVERPAVRGRLRLAKPPHARWAPRNSRTHREWLNTDEGRAHLERRAAEEAAEQEWQQRITREGAAAVYTEWDARVRARHVERLTAEIRLELTAELLSMPVPDGDSGHVPFGEMTAEQHMRRAERLAAHTDGIGETIALHLEAARMLVADPERGPVACLDELLRRRGGAA
jgi:hypothetical protein